MPTPLTSIKFQLATGVIDIPIYNVMDITNSSFRIFTSAGVGCFDLVDVSPNLPIRVRTSIGTKSINTIVEIISSVTVKPNSNYLLLDGVNDYVRTPSMTVTEVIMEFSANHSGATQRYLDINGQWMTRASTGVDSWATGVDPVYVDGVLAVKSTTVVPTNTKTTLRGILLTATTGLTTLFAGASTNLFLGGEIHDVKLYNAELLVAHYDMTTGTVQDQSGNLNHATLYNGGTWELRDSIIITRETFTETTVGSTYRFSVAAAMSDGSVLTDATQFAWVVDNSNVITLIDANWCSVRVDSIGTFALTATKDGITGVLSSTAT